MSSDQTAIVLVAATADEVVKRVMRYVNDMGQLSNRDAALVDVSAALREVGAFLPRDRRDCLCPPNNDDCQHPTCPRFLADATRRPTAAQDGQSGTRTPPGKPGASEGDE